MAGYIQDQSKGVLVADTTSILSDVQAEYKLAFGPTVNLNSNTAQGLLITAETLARSGVMRNNADVANQINPNMASDKFLDSVCALMGIRRNRNLPTQFSNIEIDGDPGTFIPKGSRCRTENGDVVYLANDVTIPNGRIINVSFTSQSAGEIALGTIGVPWTIIDGTLGWGSATPRVGSTAEAGTVKMTDIQLKMFRKDMLANQGRQTVRAIKARVMDVFGTKSISIRENDTGAPTTIDGVVFPESNAVWVCVDGGSDLDVAIAMLSAKSGGVPWSVGVGAGTPVSVSVVDQSSGQTYVVDFTRAVEATIHARVTVSQKYSVANPQQACQDAILNWAAGLQDSEPGLIVGASISAFEVAGAINVDVPGMYVKIAQVSRDGTNWSDELVADLWEKFELRAAILSFRWCDEAILL
ncbi:baseplate J family wedge protein [Aeromonas phage Gekk3-15]